MSLIENVGPVKVEIRQEPSGSYSLFRDGRSFWVKGAAGFQHLERLVAAGGNSVRTWGMDQTEAALPGMNRLGLTLCAGLWMVPPRQGFRYSDAVARAKQFEQMKEQVLLLRNEPCLLLWGVGNELELGSRPERDVWDAVEEVAAFIKEVDPLHPVMTVLASVNADTMRCIEAYCPSIDFVSINSYGDLEMVKNKLREIEWAKPYLVTEWGANGHWEVKRTNWDAEIEPTSTEKAQQVRQRYESVDGSCGQCLGSYVFLWGSKQERTPTWYGLFSEEGRGTEAVEALEALWNEAPESEYSPRISPIDLNGRQAEDNLIVSSGVELLASIEIRRGSPSMEDVDWKLLSESDDKGVGGDAERCSEEMSLRLEQPRVSEARLKAPEKKGAYRLFVEVRGPNNTLATANFPFLVA